MRQLSNSSTNRFKFQVANLTIQVTCNNSQLSDVLRERYRNFPPGKEKPFSLNIDWIGKQRSSSLLDTKTDFEDDLLTFSAAGYQGYIDGDKEQGYLKLSSSQPVEDIDYFIRVTTALFVNKVGGIMMHTAGIVRKNQSYLFFGHSGSGKTTISKISLDNGATILNDDLIVMIPQGKHWIAYGTPFWNQTQLEPANQQAPIAGMYFLIQDKNVFVKKLPLGIATAALISNVPVIPQDPTRSACLLDLLDQLQKCVPVYEIHFLPDNSFWNVITD
jgi:hypothetical protein